MNGERGFGVHLMLDLSGCEPARLADLAGIFHLLDGLPPILGMVKVTPPYVFPYCGSVPEDRGVTGFVVIAESHISIHTFQEKGYAFVDVFSCKPFDCTLAEQQIVEALQSREIVRSSAKRGTDFPRSRCRAAGLPSFPQFKPLELSDRHEIETVARRFPPYSDFSFASLFSYDTAGETQVSILSGNLAIRMLDYLSCRPFYTFLGTNDVAGTAHRLLNRAASEGIEQQLRLVPQCAVDADLNGFTVTEDADAADYLYDIGQLAARSGGEFRHKRNCLSRFTRQHPACAFAVLDLAYETVRAEINTVLHRWQMYKEKPDTDVAVEFAAIDRCLEHLPSAGLFAYGLRLGEELAAFLIGEVVHDNVLMGHFLKSDCRVPGASDFLFAQVASMRPAGCTTFNCQQDLGLLGLRAWKQSWRPSGFLKKYTIAERGI